MSSTGSVELLYEWPQAGGTPALSLPAASLPAGFRFAVGAQRGWQTVAAIPAQQLFFVPVVREEDGAAQLLKVSVAGGAELLLSDDVSLG